MMEGTKLARHMLSGHRCKNCVYLTTRDFYMNPENEFCLLDDHPGYNNTFIADNICEMYVGNKIAQNPGSFFNKIRFNPTNTFNDIRNFVDAVRKYNGTN